MSLINDALRRAKQAQQDTPPPTPPPAPNFRPVEPAVHPVRHGLGLILPISFALVALVALLLVWELSKRGTSPSSSSTGSPLNVAARPLPSEQTSPSATETLSPVTSPAPAPSPAPLKPLAGNSPQTPSSIPEHNNGSTPMAVADTNSPGVAADANDTNHPAAAEPALAPLKLQGIVYNPRRPSAMINGRVVFVGDKFRDLKVMAIHSSDVMLTGAGRTNILSLEP